MTTSRIYAYRWPARLVSHKPFAAERYSITSSWIWQGFLQKKNGFSFLFSLFCQPAHFLCKMHNPPPFSGWKTPLPRCMWGSMDCKAVFYTYTRRTPSVKACRLCQLPLVAQHPRPLSQSLSALTALPKGEPLAWREGSGSSAKPLARKANPLRLTPFASSPERGSWHAVRRD